MVFYRRLSPGKAPQVSRTLLSILADLSNAVVWMVSTLPLISKSSSPLTSPLVSVPRTTITIGIIVTFMFHSFFSTQARSRYLSFFSRSFDFASFLFIYLFCYYSFSLLRVFLHQRLSDSSFVMSPGFFSVF